MGVLESTLSNLSSSTRTPFVFVHYKYRNNILIYQIKMQLFYQVKKIKKVAKKFGSYKKMSIFAMLTN
jgi:hypothetical protein